MYQFLSPSDSYNPTQTLGQANRVRAKQRAEQVLSDGRFGGAVTKMFGKNKGDDVLADANASAQRTASNAAGVMGVIDFAGGMGRIGASDGGFSKFFNMGDGGGSGAGGAAAGLTTPWDTNSYDFFKDFKDTPSFMGEGFSIPSYDFTSPFAN
jgi:hypothetical protein